MIKIIGIEEAVKWDELVKSLPNHDIYYLSGYVKAFEKHGDGQPKLIWWENRNTKGACVIMVRDVSNDKRFPELEHNRYFDAATPYGYGGFIFNITPSDHQLNQLAKEYLKVLQENQIISVFYRFHPILKNALLSRQLCDVIDLGKTVSLDLKDEETIWTNLMSKNRNMIRKAEKNGVEIHHGKGRELLKEFREIYERTMRGDNAEEYYYFKDDFYQSIIEDLNGNYEIFYATLGGRIISMAIMLFDNDQMHYHLSGSLREFRSFAPSNLLLYKAALWGMGNGYKSFHLGGGVGSGEDPLFKFKAAFNRNSNNQFSIGKQIVNPILYNELIDKRVLKSLDFNATTNFFPVYRS